MKIQLEKKTLKGFFSGDVSNGWQTKETVNARKGNWCSCVGGDDAGEIKVEGGTLISALVYEQLATAN